MSEFERMAANPANWHSGADLASHTLMGERAARTASAYMALLKDVAGASCLAGSSIDLGAGAGYLVRAFRAAGVAMAASEHTAAGVALLQRENPELPVRQDSVAAFHEPGQHRLLVARELYPFTRVSAFTEQLASIGRLIDSLESGGALLLSGSDVAAPHCLDIHLLARTLASDARVRAVSGPWLEALLVRGGPMAGSALWRALSHAAVAPYAAWRQRYGKWAAIRTLAVVKR